MVLSGIYHREKVADILAREAKVQAAEAEAEARVQAAQAEAEAKLKVMVDAAVSKAIADMVEPAVAAAQTAALEAYRQAVAAWYERQQAAQRAGRPFAAPPPGYDNGGKGGGAAG